MSSTPPPAGASVHSDDWTDDFVIIPPQFALPALPPSPSASSSSTSFRSSSSLHQTKSPLSSSLGARPSFRPIGTEDAGFDEPDSFSEQPSSRSSTGTSSFSNLKATVTNIDLNGNTVTRLQSGGSKRLGGDTVKAKKKAVSKAWEADFEDDFDDLGFKDTASQPFSFRKAVPIPDTLDDVELIDLGDDDEATLKAGATLKAQLPPPRSKRPVKPTKTPVPDEEMGKDFEIPSTGFSKLKLKSRTNAPLRPRDSRGSLNSDWESPGESSAASGKKSSTGWGDDSPKRFSGTSATSYTESPKAHRKAGPLGEMDDEDDMEFGLVLPSAELLGVTVLTKKLQVRLIATKTGLPSENVGSGHQRTGTDETNRTGDETMEEGLVLQDSGIISQKGLDRARRKRAPMKGGTATPNAAKSLMDVHEKKERERAWNRTTPLPSCPARIRTDSTQTYGNGMRSQSAAIASNGGNNGLGRTESPLRDRPRSSLPHQHLPPLSLVSEPQSITANRLHHRKSHAALQGSKNYSIPPPSPSIPRQKSTTSLPETPGHATETPSRQKYNTTSSRVAAPTASSLSKQTGKLRGSVRQIFPLLSQEFPASSSRSSISNGSKEIVTLHQPGTGHPRGGSNGSSKGSWGRSSRRRQDEGDFENDSIMEDDREGRAGVGLGVPSYQNHTMSSMLRTKSGEERRASNEKRQGSVKKRERKQPELITPEMFEVPTDPNMQYDAERKEWFNRKGYEYSIEGSDDVQPRPPPPRRKLITPYTASSTGWMGGAAGLGTVRIEGGMQFDPNRMCWLNIDPDDEEPDPFEGLADDEDDEFGGGGTIRAKELGKFALGGGGMRDSTSSTWSKRLASESAYSTLSGVSRGSGVSGDSTISAASEASRASRASGVSESSGEGEAGGDGRYMSQALRDECKAAEIRHEKEMRGWLVKDLTADEVDARAERDWKRWLEVRVLAMAE